MRLLILLVLVVVVVLALLVLLPLRPWLEQRRRNAERAGYDPEHELDPSHAPPPVPEPEDDLGPGDRDVPPGSRRDRERHGKP